VAAGVAMVVCCALPVLIAGGALGAIGSFLGNPWVIGAAVLLVGGGVVAWRVRRHADASPDCCEPAEPTRRTER
jgi:mercuric ion transport protein